MATAHTKTLQRRSSLPDNNDIIIVCLFSHTAQALQPIDRAMFKQFKRYYRQEGRLRMVHNLTRDDMVRLETCVRICRACETAVSADTGLSEFRGTEIFSANRNSVP